MTSLEDLEKMMRLLHALERVERVARRPDETAPINTAEHSFELAILCWYIVSTQNLKLDREKILMYALVHDFVEAYAGDTFIYDEEGRKTKPAREAAALARIEDEFPEFPEFADTIHEYEARSTPEARFVYATDKLIDPLNASMETTQSIWKEFGVSWDALIENKAEKLASSDVAPYWEQLVKKLSAKRDFFFDK